MSDILKALEENDWSLGGEQSGHIISPDLASTGDGILTALQLLDIVKRSKTSVQSLSQSAMKKSPQTLRAVKLPKAGIEIIERLKPVIDEIEMSLGETGRVLVRPSGTEPILRIMVEAPTQEKVESLAQQLVEITEKILSENS